MKIVLIISSICLIQITMACGGGEPGQSELKLERRSQALSWSDFQYPWTSGVTHTVMQGNNGSFTHHCQSSYPADGWWGDCYAWDFDLTPNTPVLAAKAGTVYFQMRSPPGSYCFNVACNGASSCPNSCNVADKNCENSANYLYIAHDDGSNSLYLHLWGITSGFVSGQTHVNTGDQIGLSGCSGYVSGAHLHFMATNLGNGYANGHTWYAWSTPASFEGGTNPAQGASVTSHNGGCAIKSDGWYCGLYPGRPNESDLCQGGILTYATTCQYGCSNGHCNSASCGNLTVGWWCGYNLANANPNYVYHCKGGGVSAPDITEPCPGACTNGGYNKPDFCTPARDPGYGWWCGNDHASGYASTLYYFAGINQNSATSAQHCRNSCVTCPGPSICGGYVNDRCDSAGVVSP